MLTILQEQHNKCKIITSALCFLFQGVITLTMKERFNLNGGYLGLLQWILGDHSGHWVGFGIRDTLIGAER